MSGHCRWPGCELPVSLVEGKVDGFCCYHWKLKVGLIDPKTVIMALRTRRPLLGAGDVMTALQMDIATILTNLGADPKVVHRALLRGRR